LLVYGKISVEILSVLSSHHFNRINCCDLAFSKFRNCQLAPPG
jgi:hypothetical protein